MAEITLVNYGLGNIKAFATIYKNLNIDVAIASSSEELRSARKIILPGVGAFDWAMKRLISSGLRDLLDELVLERQVPVLGVCVGMQMMAKRSQEGELNGLGWIDADVGRFQPSDSEKMPLPHMGWNDIQPLSQDNLFKNIVVPRYYFLHSYYISPKNPEHILATANYGINFAAAIHDRHIFGTQFHPEKSHQWGIDLLHNFKKL